MVAHHILPSVKVSFGVGVLQSLRERYLEKGTTISRYTARVRVFTWCEEDKLLSWAIGYFYRLGK